MCSECSGYNCVLASYKLIANTGWLDSSIVSHEAKKKQVVRDEQVSYLHLKLVNISNKPSCLVIKD